MTDGTDSKTAATGTAVLYNDACPVCRKEIRHYAGISEKAALPIRYDDLNDAGLLTAWGVSADDAARRLHVQKNGELLSGIPAFIALWQDIPRYHWLARLVGLPGVRAAAVLVYDHILAPALYRQHLRRVARR
ncbi:thiol-disulfide oxidoreductase DCC family protein [uncultured Roseobacter sp.]|uniref:thiol-disulfide oxidoreductase DCC family protein n=1 Tax=uncultured Roseobacter sp. TaxID=114847 RepID=UPI0026243774|nr:DUF393 domain-containing protein [uncultured Roseobacter sp.]